MANIFKPKRSNTPSSIPTAVDLVDGELAVNSADKKIYLRDGSEVIEIANYSSDEIKKTELVSYASASDISNSALSISGISTYNQVGILTGTNAGDTDDNFGSLSISADGKTIVVGANADEVAGGTNTGVVYVYDRVGNSFNQVGILTGTNASDSGDNFGGSVATSADGKTIVVSSRSDEVPGSGSGSGVVYVFDRVGNTFNQVGILTGTNAVDVNDNFGGSLSISADGKTIVVGANTDEVPGSNADSGVVYVFDRVGNDFNQVGILTGTNAVDPSDNFGFSVATNADGKTIVVCARLDEVAGGTNTGVVYVFDRVGNDFNQVGILTGTNAGDTNDNFGRSLAISADGKTIIIGANVDEVPGNTDTGIAYIFDRIGNSFNQVGILTGTYAVDSGDNFTRSVATSADGKTIVIGASADEVPGSGTSSGVVYVYKRQGNTFNQVGILTGTNSGNTDDAFGFSVATSADGKTIVVGANLDEVAGGTNTGVVYVFDEERETYVYSDSSGNIGIGTDTPTAKLDVLGNLNVTGNINSAGIITASNLTEYKILDNISSSFNGSTTQFTISSSSINFLNSEITSAARLLISVGGVVQAPDPTQSNGYYISGGTDLSTDPIKINFVEAPKSGQSFFGVAYGLTISPSQPYVTPEQSIAYSIVFGV
jgi:hypothetical protein